MPALSACAVEFQLEPWVKFWTEGQIIFPQHWRELALNQTKIQMDVDAEGYATLERLGKLLVFTARSEGRLVGYILTLLMNHFHYKSAGPMALTDMYFVLPEFRHGAGARMFLAWENMLREHNVVQAITSCKVHQDHSRLFEKLGWTHSDNTFVKVLS